MYFMGHSATKFFKHWPEMRQEFDRISMKDSWLQTFKHSGENMIPPMRTADRLRAAGMDPETPPGSFQMRPLIYRMFVRQLERLGIKVYFGKRVVEYEEDEAKATAITDQKERFEADIIVAADGIGSKAQKIVGGQIRAISSGRAMWRAAFPITVLDAHPELKEHYTMSGPNKDAPIVRTYFGYTVSSIP